MRKTKKGNELYADKVIVREQVKSTENIIVEKQIFQINTGVFYLNTRLKFRTLKAFIGEASHGCYYMEHNKGRIH